jgi:hypothetical protein
MADRKKTSDCKFSGSDLDAVLTSTPRLLRPGRRVTGGFIDQEN